MPLYEYKCRQCGERLVRLQKAGQDAAGIACANCGSDALEKVFSSFSLGWTNSASAPATASDSGNVTPPAAGPEFHRLMVTNNPELLK